MTSTPDPIDIAVGQRVMQGRKLRGLSQDALGGKIGLTFQQIQKYEKGTNRISASKMVEISRALQFPIAWFFQDIDQENAPTMWDDLQMVAQQNPTVMTVLKYLALGKNEKFACFIVGEAPEGGRGVGGHLHREGESHA